MVDTMFEACLTYEPSLLDPDDFPPSNEPVWILGKKYSPVHDIDDLRAFIRSRLWFSYRRNFVPIGDSGLTSDKGWGCMLRCGQMILAQALISRHLGSGWLWDSGKPDLNYLQIIKMFEDRKAAPYSIHQIALMGASEGKNVGEWFGPNTVAQVLKKLAVYDEWTAMSIHVAMDNLVIIEDIKSQCKGQESKSDGSSNKEGSDWKPLLLFIPLRLGLYEINPIYVRSLKACFTFPQTVGVIGGKPNHALYFIGYVGDDIVFLDPHVTQQAVAIDDKSQQYDAEADLTYHCQRAARMPIMQLDPSVALCFFCKTESSFEQLCETIKKSLVEGEQQPLFEIAEKRPAPYWSERTSNQDQPSTSKSNTNSCSSFEIEGATSIGFCEVEDQEEEFEIL